MSWRNPRPPTCGKCGEVGHKKSSCGLPPRRRRTGPPPTLGLEPRTREWYAARNRAAMETVRERWAREGKSPREIAARNRPREVYEERSRRAWATRRAHGKSRGIGLPGPINRDLRWLLFCAGWAIMALHAGRSATPLVTPGGD